MSASRSRVASRMATDGITNQLSRSWSRNAADDRPLGVVGELVEREVLGEELAHVRLSSGATPARDGRQ